MSKQMNSIFAILNRMFKATIRNNPENNNSVITQNFDAICKVSNRLTELSNFLRGFF
jgi:hypothetical protein